MCRSLFRSRRDSDSLAGTLSCEKRLTPIFLLSITCVAGLFACNAYVDIDFADEGYLWYGSVQTARGGIPIKDFDSYDPGRYYWNALWFRALSDEGIITLRLAESGFHWVGLTLSLLLIRRVSSSWTLVGVAAFLLTAWAIPRHKTYEHTIQIALIFVGAHLLNYPSRLRFLAAGVVTGLAAFFGQNHGLYAVAAFSVLFAYISLTSPTTRVLVSHVGTFVSGAFLAYLPGVLMLAISPGFRFWFSLDIMDLINRGGTNIPLPVPWPWSVELFELSPSQFGPRISLALLFVALPFTYLAGFLLGLRKRGGKRQLSHNVILVAATVGAVYYHLALSRADLNHLAQSIDAFLIATLVLPKLITSRVTRAAAYSLSFLVIVPLTWQCAVKAQPFFVYWTNKHLYRPTTIGDDIIRVPAWKRDLIETIRKIDATQVGPGSQLLIAPFWPGFYPILDRKSPIRETFFLFNHSDERQQLMISELEKNRVNYAIIGNAAFGRRTDRRFQNTHRLLWTYITRRYKEVATTGLPEGYTLFVRRSHLKPRNY